MSKEDRIEYLEEERVKLWATVRELQEKLSGLSSEEIQKILEKGRGLGEIVNAADEFRGRSSALDAELATIAERIRLVAKDLEKTNAQAESEMARIVAGVKGALEKNEEIEKYKTESNKAAGDLAAVAKEIEEKKAILATINDLRKEAAESSGKIKLLAQSATKKEEEIREVATLIHGHVDAVDEKKNVEGLKGKLEKTFSELERDITVTKQSVASLRQKSEADCKQLQEKWSAEHDGLSKRIQNLLPNALTAGLSHAYQEKRENEHGEMKKSNRIFLGAIVAMTLVSLIPFAIGIYFLFNNSDLRSVIEQSPRVAITILPLYIPALWMAYSSNKKSNLSKRLIEEYAHKEALSKTFEGLSRQIEAASDGESYNELRLKLLYNLLEVSSENPGKLITDYNKSDHPLMDALDKSVKLTNAVRRLAALPGFSALAQKVQGHADRLVDEQNQKADAGIAMIQEKPKDKK